MISSSPKLTLAMAAFFISYTQADRPWAEWIAWTLEGAGHSVGMQAWDFRPGGNFVVEMQRAILGSDRTIAVLSPDYLLSLFANSEWAAAFAADPDGTRGKLVPIQVRTVPKEDLGLWAAIIHIDLVGLGEAAAREAIVKGLVLGRVHPESVRFPGAHLFPGQAAAPPDPAGAESALAALPLEEVPKPGPLPIGSRMLLAPNPLFVGREEDLKSLARQLKAGGTSAVGQVEIAAATGLGGIGKTQLASEFVHRYGRYFAGGVFWMSFADAASVPAEIAACGHALGLHSGFDTLTSEQQVRLVETAWQSPLPRLLIFDNCEEEELLRRRRPSFGGARVLVTSRKAEWDAALNVKTVPITTLPRPVSIELLRRFRPEVPADDSVFGSIAEELGDLPLALHLAGSFLKTYRSTTFGEPGKYLEALREPNLLDHPSLMGKGAGASPTGHSADVGRTFALSFERLDPTKATDATAIRLLVRAAWFAPGEPIPRSLLLRSAGVNSEALSEALNAEDALRRLTDLGLLEMDERNDPRMHRLVAAWAVGVGEGDRAQAAVEEVWIAEAARLNEIANPAALRSWLPHLRAVTDRVRDREDRAAALLCDELGIHLWQAGDYSGAQLYLERAVALHEVVSGLEDPGTARSLNSLGRVLHGLGNYKKAQIVFERTLEIRERVLGLNHPDTAHSLNDLGVVMDDQGNYEGSRLAHERALAIREHALGLEHRDTALSLDNLGVTLFVQSDLISARRYCARALAIREKVLGPEHPETAASLNNLGLILRDLGEVAGARSSHERALAICEKILGPEHPYTATSLNNLGSILRDLGDLPGARLYHEQALAILEKVLGPEHPNTARSLNNLGGLLQELGDLAGVRHCYERVLAIRETVLGPEHVDTARSLYSLGVLSFQQGNFAKARSLWERALRILNSRLGPNHPETNRARSKLRELPGARRIKKRRP
ncbi:MAG TPA: FxSxx-COOH system tetratricopeptide repeat protein [Thermoanaerobaculia bacterium]|jgi:tetratricopeptide (TPR) repeat protein|nr:FxSxx-COOH system tetratricopeptide repeat protein [Thermoanaerobaculia bacterium]